MKRLPLLLLSGLAVAAMAACGGKKPETTPVPQPMNADSAAEAERIRADSIARAEREAKEREQAERRRQQQIADSLAALGKSTEAASRPCRTVRNGRWPRDTTRTRGPRIAATSSRFSPAART